MSNPEPPPPQRVFLWFVLSVWTSFLEMQGWDPDFSAKRGVCKTSQLFKGFFIFSSGVRLQNLRVMAVWETPSQLRQWCQKVFKSQIGSMYLGEASQLRISALQPGCKDDALFGDCHWHTSWGLLDPSHGTKEEAQDQAKTRPFGGGMSTLWDESGVASPHLTDVQKFGRCDPFLLVLVRFQRFAGMAHSSLRCICLG